MHHMGHIASLSIKKTFFLKSIYAVYTKHDKTVPVLIHFIDEPR